MQVLRQPAAGTVLAAARGAGFEDLRPRQPADSGKTIGEKSAGATKAKRVVSGGKLAAAVASANGVEGVNAEPTAIVSSATCSEVQNLAKS